MTDTELNNAFWDEVHQRHDAFVAQATRELELGDETCVDRVHASVAGNVQPAPGAVLVRAMD